MARGLHNATSIVAASKMNVDGANLSSVKLAYKILQTGLDNITNIVSGAETMEVRMLYTKSVFHRRWLAKQHKVTITLDNYEDEGAVAGSGRRKALPVEDDYEPVEKIPQKDKGNVGPLI